MVSNLTQVTSVDNHSWTLCYMRDTVGSLLVGSARLSYHPSLTSSLCGFELFTLRQLTLIAAVINAAAARGRRLINVHSNIDQITAFISI